MGNVRADRVILLSADAPSPNQSNIAKRGAVIHERRHST